MFRISIKYVILRDNETGRVAYIPSKEDNYMWTEGNFSCDCNRHILFWDALNEEPPLEYNECECGESRYDLLAIIE